MNISVPNSVLLDNGHCFSLTIVMLVDVWHQMLSDAAQELWPMLLLHNTSRIAPSETGWGKIVANQHQ